MTLNEALARVHPWLDYKPERCTVTGGFNGKLWCCAKYGWWNHKEAPPYHTKPLPPATDELAMKVLRKLKAEKLLWFVANHTDGSHQCEIWNPETVRDSFPLFYAESGLHDDPRDAIIIAAATWLQSQDKQKE